MKNIKEFLKGLWEVYVYTCVALVTGLLISVIIFGGKLTLYGELYETKGISRTIDISNLNVYKSKR